MALTVHRKGEQIVATGLIADRRLCLTADGQRLVEAGALEAAVLFAAKGQPIPEADVKRLGLAMVDGKVVQGGAAPERQAAALPETEPEDVKPDATPKGRSKKGD